MLVQYYVKISHAELVCNKERKNIFSGVGLLMNKRYADDVRTIRADQSENIT